MKTYLTLLMSLGLVFAAYSRGIIEYSFDALADKSTVVVIATPTTVMTTTNQGTIDGGSLKGTVVETSFRILGVLKGDRSIKELTLRHFALESETNVVTFEGPRLVTFEPNSHKQYLMFLQKEIDGRYVAVTGQEDPIDSVKQLKEDEPVWVNLNTGKP